MKYHLVFLFFASPLLWAVEPNNSQKMHPLNNIELRNITDHQHNSKGTAHTVNHHAKTKQQTKADSTQNKALAQLILPNYPQYKSSLIQQNRFK